MRCEWEKTTLGDIASFRYGKMPDKTLVRDVATEDYYPINSGYRVTGYYPEYNISSNSLIVVARGVGGTGDVKIIRERSYLTNLSIVIDVNESYVLKEYLYYLFFLDNLAYLNSGSAQSQLTIRDLERVQVSVPAIDIQRSVIKTLSTLDEKIELNNKINENLEQQAQAIFKSWFVDFEPFQDGKFVESELGMIPEGWGVRSLDEIAEYTNGLAMQRYRPENDEPGLPVLKIRELRQQFPDINSDRCTENIEEKFIVYDGDVIFSWSGSLLVDLWTGGKAGLNQHLFKVTSEKFPKWFYYYWTKYHLERFQYIAKSRATTMGHITRGHLREAKVLIPPKQVLGSITTLMDKILKMKINLRLENNTLANLRDTLLPKLMSGEIEVPVE